MTQEEGTAYFQALCYKDIVTARQELAKAEALMDSHSSHWIHRELPVFTAQLEKITTSNDYDSFDSDTSSAALGDGGKARRTQGEKSSHSSATTESAMSTPSLMAGMEQCDRGVEAGEPGGSEEEAEPAPTAPHFLTPERLEEAEEALEQVGSHT